MKQLATLFRRLDETNGTNEKVEALKMYLQELPDKERLHALALFTGRRPRRILSSTLLKAQLRLATGIGEWLFNECYGVTGDLAETISLLLPAGRTAVDRPLSDWMGDIYRLTSAPEDERIQWIRKAWANLSREESFVLNKILTGSFRLGVSHSLIVRALSEVTSLPTDVLTHRLSGNWHPSTSTLETLTSLRHEDRSSQLYPFYLAYPLTSVLDLGEASQWLAEWKWDGIRSQMIRRKENVYIWSRGEELITDGFPELAKFAETLPNGTVLDGELVCIYGGTPMPFQLLQTRIARKKPSAAILANCPAGFIAYDVLEWKGVDIRDQPLATRRAILKEAFVRRPSDRFFISVEIEFQTWEELAEKRAASRSQMAEGIMLKRLTSTYGTGRKRGDWWKWKIDPLTVDGVLIYAQKGQGRRADLFTDYTFAVWDGSVLVSFAKAYSGLTDKEIAEVDRFVKANTVERFGPVRTVKPELVFEIGFEGIGPSSRHKSGVALRFPRILRWRKDKLPAQADHIEALQSLIGIAGRI